MKAWYQVKKSVFSAKECAEMIAYANKQKPVVGVVGHGGKAVEHEMRRSTVRWLSPGDVKIAAWTMRLRALWQRANAEVFGFDCQDFMELQFTEYDSADEGHYDWHEDSTWVQGERSSLFDRKLSIVVQLSKSEDYEGGELLLAGQENVGFVERGDVIVFPSFLRHKVTPVLAGVRYSLVAWVQGPRFR
jgi:PKHD-type hydroxylase